MRFVVIVTLDIFQNDTNKTFHLYIFFVWFEVNHDNISSGSKLTPGTLTLSHHISGMWRVFCFFSFFWLDTRHKNTFTHTHKRSESILLQQAEMSLSDSDTIDSLPVRKLHWNCLNCQTTWENWSCVELLHPTYITYSVTLFSRMCNVGKHVYDTKTGEY